MSTTTYNKRKKHISAMIIAFVMTGLVAILMLALGVNALFNQNVTSAEAAPAAMQIADLDSMTVEELRDLVLQYQDREMQYQAELVQAADQLSETNAQLQQSNGLLTELQNAGVIQIDGSGQITLLSNPSRVEREEHHGLWGDDD